jgi:hypothetical protein
MVEARTCEAETTLAPLTSGFEVMYQYSNISWESRLCVVNVLRKKITA